MDHPSKDWKNNETKRLKESKAKLSVRNRHFRFMPLGGIDDHMQCLLWELSRTEIFLKLKASDECYSFLNDVDGFPNLPYLNFKPEVRAKWKWTETLDLLSKKEEERFYNLLESHIGSTEEVEIGSTETTTFVCHTPTLKIPVELNIHPYWSSQKLIKLFKEQIDPIIKRVEENQRKLESNGCRILKIIERQPLRTIQKKLKLLGHFRLSKCVGLDYAEWQQGYSGTLNDNYSDESTLWRDLKKVFPQFKTSLNDS